MSIGHRVCLETAIRFVLACTTRFRLPETTRAADRLSKFRAVTAPAGLSGGKQSFFQPVKLPGGILAGRRTGRSRSFVFADMPFMRAIVFLVPVCPRRRCSRRVDQFNLALARGR
jgi:hypothetical protein